MMLKKDVLTTGQVAQICNVAPRTVTKWFDAGQLKGYRIPGSRDRRIPISELITFMKEHDIPTDGLEKGQIRILIIDSHAEDAHRFADSLEANGGFDVECAHSSFDSGLMVQKFMPNIILINLMSNDINAHDLCSYVHSNPELSDCAVVAMASGLSENEASNLLCQGFSSVVTDTSNVIQILQAIQDSCAVLQ